MTLSRFPSPHRRPSMVVYLILMNAVLLCFLLPVLSTLVIQKEEKFRDEQLMHTLDRMKAEIRNSGTSLARGLALSAGEAIAGYDFTFVNSLLRELVTHDPNIEYALIVDIRGHVLAHNDLGLVGSVSDSSLDINVMNMMKTDFRAVAATDDEKMADPVRFIETGGGNSGKKAAVMEAIAPIYNGNRLEAVLRCGYSLRRFNEEAGVLRQEYAQRMKQFKRHMLSITAIFFLIGAGVVALFARFFARSVKVFNEGVQRVAAGNLEYSIEKRGLFCAEFMELSHLFNVMTDKLKRSYKQLDDYSQSLELKVEERTRELQETQARLMQQAHEAGMAEMAVGMLHNIGNAITPAKVGSIQLLKMLKKSAIRNHMPEIMNQIRQVVETSSLPSADRVRLLTIIGLMPRAVEEEYGGIIREIEKIGRKHEHIETIIRLRLRYSDIVEEIQEIDVNRVIEDALEFMEESIAKRSIQVEKRFSNLPSIRFAKSRLIQIVINLIKNACEAMEDPEVREKRLILSTRMEAGEPTRVILSVRDTGTGFSSEEKSRLFSFGYTTKSRGFGFGLHSAANYLIAKKCSISAQSDGKGRGAEFVIGLMTHVDSDR